MRFLDLISFRSYSRFEVLDFLAVTGRGCNFLDLIFITSYTLEKGNKIQNALILDLISFRPYSRFEILDFLPFARTVMQVFRSYFLIILFFREEENKI